MKDAKANVELIKHITKRMDEFFDQYQADEFLSLEQFYAGFARFLRMKEMRAGKIPNRADGMVAQELYPEDVVDEHSATLAFVKILENGKVGMMWLPQVFSSEMAMPDELREELILLLRFHAKKLEDHSLDERMRECAGKMTGAA